MLYQRASSGKKYSNRDKSGDSAKSCSVSSRTSKSEASKSEASMSENSLDKDEKSTCNDRHHTVRELAYNIRDAVVLISGQGILIDSEGNRRFITTTGNGFFIKGYYIICPASLVLMNPTLFLSHKRMPDINNISVKADLPKNSENLSTFNFDKEDKVLPNYEMGAKIPSTGNIEEIFGDRLIRACKILVDVSNVNGFGKSYSYEADIIGVDGAANIAILRINMSNHWNEHNPHLRIIHPFLCWGKSRNSCPGDTVMMIGNTMSCVNIGLSQINDTTLVTENAVVTGILSDNRYVFPGGQIPGELLLLSNIFSNGSQSGLPVITIQGYVIGMVVSIFHSQKISERGLTLLPSYNMALSEFFMRRPVKGLIQAYQNKCVPDHYRGFIENTVDPIGNYLNFNKAWLGLGGILMNQNDFDTDFSINVGHSGNIFDFHGSFEENKNISISRIPVLDHNNHNLTNFSGLDSLKYKRFTSSSKEIIGYRILSVYNLNNGPRSTPNLNTELSSVLLSGFKNPNPDQIDSNDLTSSWKNISPLYEIISIGDIVTHINGCPLGNRKGQISPSLVMWRVRPGDYVKIIYRKQSERFTILYEISIRTKSYEPSLDFPYYSSDSGSIFGIPPILI
jgi:hypothetical protein